MTPGARWFRVTILVPASSAEDAAADLADLGATGVRVEDGDPARLETHYSADFASGAAAVAVMHGGKLESAAWVEEEDWAQAWRKRVPSLVVGGFCIHPTHEPPREGLINFRLDPGMAFGTGEHATTRLMLLELEALAAARSLGRTLDLGCGTGILAMAAAALGAMPVVAADTDERAVEIARELAKENGYGDRIEFVAGSLSACRGPFDTIVANLTTDVHARLADSYRPALGNRGRLRIGGIRAIEAGEVARMTGARELRRDSDWVLMGLEL